METGVSSGSSYTIGGVKVEFPCKAYPTQLSMMSMIIKGIERRQNCLLESPTGSGKSLALLCSCLAWQQNEYRKRDEETAAEECQQNGFNENIICTCDCRKNPPPAENGTAPTPARPCCSNETCQPSTSNENHCAEDAEPNLKTTDSPEDDDDDEDFKPSKKRFRTPGSVGGASKRSKGPQGVVFEEPSDDESPDSKTADPSKAHWQMKLNNESSNKVGEDSGKTSCQCACHSSKEKDLEGKQKEPYKRRKIPKIFFGTRTHKQITQIIRELGKTVYKDVPMCILGSREHTCVHPDVSRSFSKNEGCKELLKGKNGRSCRYYNGAHKIKNQWQLRDRGLTTAWDIEDIVSLGKKIKACPFFAVRSLKDEADIIFCPYNYLVDPMIRMTMDITMKNQIIVLDEAHNIEDSAREAASCSVTVDQLEETVSELDHHIKYEWREVHCRVMHSVSSALLQWVKSHSTNLTQRDFERALRVWSGSEIVTVLRDLGITKDTLATFQHHLAALSEEPEPQQRDQENGVELSNNVNMTLKGLFLIIEFLFKNDMKYMKDFKVAIVRTIARGNRFQNNDNRWISKRRSSDQSWTLTLNFWCLNPAVAFTDFGEEVRCIILTSGTLSPMSSFQSELGVLFPIQLEANHVVHLSQVWVGTVAMGPNGGSLNGSYKNAETFSFQDEIGLLLLQVCQVVPYGVLCFLPSYGMMNKLSQRWKNTGLWDRLEQVKVVMTEARGAEKVNFDEHLREFYEVIKDCESKDIENCSVTGAVCLAVCRGKVSEGMDFADNNARAVMTIGIPFPSIKDTQVELKRQYNDQYSSSRGLLSGSEWYEIQAYRAVNQALGRCIRHKRDWGALILVDDRFGKNPKKYITGLSKWVRGKVVHHTHARDALESLDEFAKARLLCPCPNLPSLPTCASPSSSEVLNMTITQKLPATPSTPLALPTIDLTQSNILKPITQQGEHSQPLAHATPLKFFKHSSGPNASPSPQFAFGSGNSGHATPINVGPATPIKVGPAMPVAVGTTPATPNFVCPATPISVGPAMPMGVSPATPIVVGPATPISIGPSLATPISFRPATPMVIHPTTPLPVGPTSLVYQFGENTIIIPQQASTQSTLGRTTSSTPKPLKGQLVKQMDNGTKIVKLMLVKNEAVMPILSPPNKPCIEVVANAQPSVVQKLNTTTVATSCAAKTAMVVHEFKENLPQYVAIKLNRMIVEGNMVLREEGSKSAVMGNGLNQPVVDNAQQNVVTLGVPTLLPTSNADSAIKNKISACDSREPQSNLSGFAMVPPHNTTADSSNIVDLTSDDKESEATSVQQNVKQMESQRADCNNTPLLFESDDISFDECPSVVEKAPENMGVELSRKQADNPCDMKESDKSVNLQLPDQATEEIGTIQTPPSTRTVETRLSTKKRKATRLDLSDDGSDQEEQTRSECRMSLRRSSRRRSGRNKEPSSRARCLEAEGDFLDDIAAKTSQKPQQDAASCRTGMFCATCHCCFTEKTNGVRLVSESETGAQFSFLSGQMNKSNLSSSRTKRLSHAPKKFCQCSNLNTPKGCKGTGGGLVLMPADGLDNLSTLTKTQTSTEKDLTLNAHWSEQDQCCYQPITCSVCQTKRNATPTVIGYKLVAMGTTQESSNVVGQVWLFAKNVAHCERLQLQDQGVPTA